MCMGKMFVLANADLCNCFKVRDDNTWGCMTPRVFCTISNVSDYQCQVFSVRVCENQHIAQDIQC